jgi:hypothetical protein
MELPPGSDRIGLRVWMSRSGHLHLADFGLSKQITQSGQILTTFCGTPCVRALCTVGLSGAR